MKELYVVDETGEIVDTIESQDRYMKLGKGDRVIRKGTIDYLNDSVDLRYRFVKINPEIFDTYCKKYSILPSLVSHISYMDNVVAYKNGKKIYYKQLKEICGVSITTIKRQIKGMIEDDLVHKSKEDGERVLILNPYLCMRGKRISKFLYEEFKMSELQNHIDRWAKDEQ